MSKSVWNHESVVALRSSLAALVLGLGLSSVSAQDAPAESRLGSVEQFESDSFNLNRTANTMTFDGFRIYGDNWSLTADAALANADELDFESGQWRFEGNISLQLDKASLEAESAAFVFRDKRLVKAELSGNPVVFQDEATAENEAVFGSAETIRYDDDAETFELLGSVSLTVGPYRTTGCNLLYYLGQEEFTTGSAQCPEPFVTTIVQQESAETTVD
jgi:lipopolysaccharide transport protein LptA